MSDRRGATGLLTAALAALLGVLVALAVNAVYGYLPPAVTADQPLWIGLLTLGTTATAVLTWRSSRGGGTPVSDAAWWMVPAVPGWVDRPELAKVVSALTGSRAGKAGTTTGLTGAGGFGKTMLAAKACHDKAIRRRFRGVVWITVGQKLDAPALAARISETVRNLGIQGSTFTSLEEAGKALAGVLAARGHVLVVADDVWTAEQLVPFAIAARQGQLLVTTRRTRLLPEAAVRQVKVDAVTDAVGEGMLTGTLPAMPSQVVRDLLRLAGGWPLLLTLIRDRLALDAARRGGSIEGAATEAIARLRQAGPTALDSADETSRQLAVEATVDYSLAALPTADRERFFELAVFPEAEIPVVTLSLLWAGMDDQRALTLCEALDGLSLATLVWSKGMRTLVLHDVIRELAHRRLGPSRSVAAHRTLISAARHLLAEAGLPAQATRSLPAVGGATAVPNTSWWQLPHTAATDYLWQYLTYHLKEAELIGELGQVCSDLRFVAAKLLHAGPAAAESDLARSTARLAGQFRLAIAQNAHLLAPMDPRSALATTLTSRLGHVREAAGQLEALRSGLDAWTAWPEWPMPDQASDALIRALYGAGDVEAVAIAPDCTWLVTGHRDGSVRIWDVSGAVLRELTGHQRGVTSVAIASGGTWIATGGWDGSVRIWDVSGALLRELKGHKLGVSAVAIAAHSAQIATGSVGGSVRIWDVSGAVLRELKCPERGVESLAIAPDGTWLATGGIDGMTRIWDASGSLRRQFKSYRQAVRALAIAPDGTWLATGHEKGAVRIWDVTGTLHRELTYHRGGTICVVIAEDGSWIGTGGHDGSVRIWSANGSLLREVKGDKRWTRAIAIAPDGTFAVASYGDETVRILDISEALRHQGTQQLHEVKKVAIAPDGTWIAAGSKEGTVWLWDASGSLRHEFEARYALRALVVAPDSTWLATSGWDGTVRIWDASGSIMREFEADEDNSPALAIAPTEPGS